MASNSRKPKSAFALIRATTDREVKLLNDLKAATNETTYTKALMTAGELFLQQKKHLENELQQNKKLSTQLQQAEELLHRYHAANNSLNAYCKKFPAQKYPQREIEY